MTVVKLEKLRLLRSVVLAISICPSAETAMTAGTVVVWDSKSWRLRLSILGFDATDWFLRLFGAAVAVEISYALIASSPETFETNTN